jgi:hypothetical protein
MPVNADPLFADHAQSGLGFRDEDGDWTFIDTADEPWLDSLSATAFFACTAGPGAKVQKDKFDKEGNLISSADTSSGEGYARFMGYYAYVGFEAYSGAQIIAYSYVTYRFGPSDFDPGTRALFRVSASGEQELAGLFDSDSGFEFVLANGQVRNSLPPGHTDDVRLIRIKAFATKDNQAGGASRTLDYDATVDVPLRNFGDE